MGMIVGGPRAWKKRRHGNFVVAFHWVNGEGAMVIVNDAIDKCPAAVICQSVAHLYADSKSGDPTAYCARKSLEYANAMGLIRIEAPKIMRIIVEAIPDLLEMPPEPDWERIESNTKAVDNAVAKLVADGQVVMEAPVRLQ